MAVCRLWHLCQPRYPRFVHFSWSFPVNWYIQSILLYPAIKPVTLVSARFSFHAQLQTCLAIPSLHTYQRHPNPMPSTCLFSLTLLTLHYDYHLPFLFSATGRLMLSSEYNSPRTRHDLYTPTLLFSLQVLIFSLAVRRTIYEPFMFSTLLFILHDPTVYRFSLPTRCGFSLHPTPSSRPGSCISFLVVLERFSSRTVSYYPAVPQLSSLPRLYFS